MKAGDLRARPRQRIGTHIGLVEQSLRDRRTKIHDKATPYVPEGLRRQINHNCKVMVDPGVSAHSSEADESEPREVECRHFALEWARKRPGEGKRRLTADFASEVAVVRQFDGKLRALDAELSELLRMTPQHAKHSIDEHQVGDYLSSVAHALATRPSHEGTNEANCLMLSVDHAFALHVERKAADGLAYFSAKLYDPNATAAYTRVEALEPEDFKAVTGLEGMLPNDELAPHYSAGPGETAPLVVICLEPDLELDPTHFAVRTRLTVTAEEMRLALSANVADEINALVTELASQGPVSNQALIKLLEAKSESSTEPGLYRALSDGHTESVQNFVNVVLTSTQLGEAQMVSLLMASDSEDDCPGFLMAMQEDHSDTVFAYVSLVLASTLSDERKVELLKAQWGSHGTGLDAAEHPAAARTVYIDLVRQSSLDDTMKEELGVPAAPGIADGL